MEQINAMYKFMETKSKMTKSASTGASIDLESLTLVKGKKGKLGRGSHGVVKLAHYQPDGGGKPRKVAIKMVPVDEPDAQAALQVRLLFVSPAFSPPQPSVPALPTSPTAAAAPPPPPFTSVPPTARAEHPSETTKPVYFAPLRHDRQ